MITPAVGDTASLLLPLRAGMVAEAARQPSFHGLVGRGPAMQEIFAAMFRFAPHARVVLVSGEVGTGKAVVARTLHHLGPRLGGPFVATRCSAAMNAAHLRLPFESGASPDAADPGSVFIADIDELPWALQSALLELLDAGETQLRQRRQTGPHVIAATTRDLRAEVARGRFRADLFYRLTAFELRLPPLRERLEDIARLAARFTQEAAERLHRPALDVTAGAVRLLQTLQWQGNLRELRNVIERACIRSDDSTLGEGDIRAALCHAPPRTHLSRLPGSAAGRLDQDACSRVRDALDEAHGNKSAAARHLGVSRWALYRLLHRHA